MGRLLLQEDDADEDFKPSPVDEEEEGEEAGVRRRNIQARELNDLLQDAYKQVTAGSTIRYVNSFFSVLFLASIVKCKVRGTRRFIETVTRVVVDLVRVTLVTKVV